MSGIIAFALSESAFMAVKCKLSMQAVNPVPFQSWGRCFILSECGGRAEVSFGVLRRWRPLSASFTNELSQWGPATEAMESPTGQVGERLSISEAESYCKNLARAHYENFPVLTFFVPAELRQHFANIYAYCRWSDDLADEVTGEQQSLDLLKWWRESLGKCFDGQATHPVFVALQQTIREFEIPPKPFEDLISAFEQDQHVHAYQSFADLQDYCCRSANPVGELVLYLCRNHTEQNLEWSNSICTGLQLANFWQDVQRDHEIGRCYLPIEDGNRFGYQLEDWQNCVTNAAFLELMKYEVGRAREFLTAGLPLSEQMPGRLKIVIELFARGGLRILDRIESIGFRVWECRPVLTKLDTVRLMGTCLVRRAFGNKYEPGRIESRRP